MGKTLGIITVGQSPRPDLVEDIATLLGPDVDVLEAGLLDGLDERQIETLAPRDPEGAVVTRRADGSPVVVDVLRVAERLAERIAYLEQRGADLSVVCCTADVPPVPSRRTVIYPGRLLPQGVAALLGDGRLGVVVPLHRQRPAAQRRWSFFAGRLVVGVFHPYVDDGGWGELARAFRQEQVDMIVLDSFGYSPEMRAELASLTGLPVICARRFVARVVAELL